MEQDFYRGRLESRGLHVRVPPEPDRSAVHQIIYEELVKGVINPESRQTYLSSINRMIDDGATGVIGGCTEIELLVSQDDLHVPFFPTAELHALAAVDWSLRN
jgi:aspartate racemase